MKDKDDNKQQQCNIAKKQNTKENKNQTRKLYYNISKVQVLK